MDGEMYDDISAQFNCELVQGLHLMTLGMAHLYVERLLRVALTDPESYLLRIDPDTGVWRRFSHVPAFSSLFGTLETISERRQEEICVPANVQGGCVGITCDAAVEIVSSGILNYESCGIQYNRTWARCSDMSKLAAAGKFCDDFVISWAAWQMGIPIVESSEIRSRWRRTPNSPIL